MGISERKEREKEQRKNDIIDAAEKVFFKKGFNNATIDEVADLAEISKGTVYLYFKSKEDLHFAIFMRGAEILMRMMQKDISIKKNGLENLIAVGQTFIRFSKEYENYFPLFMLFQGRDILELNIGKEQMEKFIVEQSPHTIIFDLVKLGIKDGSLRNDISEGTFATTLWAQMLGVLQVIHSKKEVLNMLNIKAEEVLATHLELVINGGKNRS